jgi:outer membrane PBP1 activator LpoA protein
MHGFIYLSQTNFLAFNLFKQKHSNISFILLILITLFINGCSSKSATKKSDNLSKIKTQEIKATETAEQKIALAQSLHDKSASNKQLLLEQQVTINTLLIEASELYVQQQDFSKALWLANEINNTFQENHLNTYRLLLIKAKSLFKLNYFDEAQKQLELAKELVVYTNKNDNISPLKLTYNYYQILNQLSTAQEKTIIALVSQLNAFALNPEPSYDDIQSLWYNFERLTPWQLALLVNKNPPFIEGWAQLLNYSNQFGDNPKQFSRYLTLWQQNNPTHPAAIIIKELESTNVLVNNPVVPAESNMGNDFQNNPDNDSKNSLGNVLPLNKTNNTGNDFTDKIENIAILLPLSGNQRKAGLAAQQGILAAYDNNTESSIFFIDTNQVEWENLPSQFTELNVDHIIGPLLIPNVEVFLSLSEQHPSLQVPTLLLNLPSQHQLSVIQTALSMRPEDEAIQAAATLSQKNYRKPIVLSHDDRVSKRIAMAFKQQWQISTGKLVEIVYFNQGKEMQASLKENLDVDASQKRIKLLTGQLKNKIESEARNRRDIDMIYLIGSASQTRLIKPYIDVNISPFADIIPVYASSRSHSSFNDKHSSSSTNDLQSLTFTQIPWLLTSQQQNKTLRQLSDNIWPKRSDSLSRIFAMGFDSYNLLSKLSLMKKAPYIRHFGQTGVLILNKDNIITRSLIWGQYKNDKVIQIVMD